jgi:NAD(P)-dependent dehydrogenase (short-subunit alcohol dehydrogenase family)
MEQLLKGKTALVTGAGWGIGAAIALLYAAYGANVIVSDTSRNGGKDTLAKIKSKKGNAIYIRTDVNDPAACQDLIKRTIRKYGHIDIACNNSAIDVDFIGLSNCMQYEIEAMQKQGGGIIVNTSAIVGAASQASMNTLIDEKYGITRILQNTHGEYPERGIHINTLAPAIVATILLQRRETMMETKGGIDLFPMSQPGLTQAVAGLILWMSSDETRILPAVSNASN